MGILENPAIKAIVFDYGNTLVEFGPDQVSACDAALAATLAEHFGPPDPDRLKAIRNRNRMAPYHGDPPEYRENNLPQISLDLVRELYGVEPPRPALNAILRTRFQAFVDAVAAPDYLPDLLETLHQRYRLGLLSNYPDGHAIRASLQKTGLDRYLETVVVSGDVGHVKPHPLPFRVLLSEMMLTPDEVLFVGDNWLADVQGARRAGLTVVHLRQWTPAETFHPQSGDLLPDAEITHLSELPDLF